MGKGIKARVSRRRLLGDTLLAASSLTALARAFGQGAASGLAGTPLADGLVMVRGAGANVVVMPDDDGLLMVDGGAPERSAALIDYAARQWPGRPVRALFNTNWGWEHTGSNRTLGETGAQIVAHENTKLRLGGTFKIEWQDNRVHEPYPKVALPTTTFVSAGRMTFGRDPVTYGHFAAAHTDGDLYVFLPEHNVLVVGDLLSVGRYPIVDYSTGGSISGMTRAAEGLLDIADADTQIVPAVGPVQRRTDLVRYRELCATLTGRIDELIERGLSLEEIMAAAPTREYDSRWGDPELFLTLVYQDLNARKLASSA